MPRSDRYIGNGTRVVPTGVIGLLTAITLIIFPAIAHAKRLALVVGIDQYEALPKLERATNDARAIGEALGRLGFDVSLVENASRRQISKKLSDIETRIAPGDTVLFYFAGHGIAIGATNILIPADMPLPEAGGESIVEDEGFAIDGIVRRLKERGAGATLLILDACRNNPFDEGGTRNIGGKRGLTRIEAASGVFVLMSAGAGQTALDRLPGEDANPNSVFTRALLPLLAKPGMSHIALAKSVQKEVARLASSIGHAQQPAYYDEILGEIVLNEAEGAAAPTETASTAPAAEPAPAASSTTDAQSEWSIVQNTESQQVLEEFIAKHGDVPIYGALAKEALAVLKETNGVEEPDSSAASDEVVSDESTNNQDETQLALAAPVPSSTDDDVPVTECDRLTATPDVPSTAALGLEGIPLSKIDGKTAVPTCIRDLAAHPRSSRLRLAVGLAALAAGMREQAFTWFQKAADMGYPLAMTYVGQAYYYGIGVTADASAAATWSQKAANQDEPMGMYALGLFLAAGEGVAKDDDAAVSWLRKSAEAGYPPAMMILAVLLEQGRGAPEDDVELSLWQQKVQADKHSGSWFDYASLLEDGKVFTRDSKNAAQAMLVAVGLGSYDARALLASGAKQQSAAFRREVQLLLKEKFNVYDGPIDEVLGDGVRKAVDAVFGQAK